MRINILAVATAAALVMGVVGSASAATLSDSVQLTYNVEPTCTFDAIDTSIDGSIYNDPEFGILQSNAFMGTLSVMCNQGTAYTIETDAAAGGLVNLVGDNTAGTVPAYLFQGEQLVDGEGNPYYDTAFSTDANGEAIHGVATGNFDNLNYQVSFNSDASGTVMLPVPVADTYRATVNFTYTY